MIRSIFYFVLATVGFFGAMASFMFYADAITLAMGFISIAFVIAGTNGFSNRVRQRRIIGKIRRIQRWRQRRNAGL